MITIILVLIYSSIIFAQNVVYIDPTNQGDPGQDGSIDHPWDSWSDVSPQSNTSYLQKRGTLEVRSSTLMTLSSSSLHDIYIGAYGTGERPQIHFDDANGIYLKFTTGITIENLELIGNYGVTEGVFHNDAIYLSGHTSGTNNTSQTTIRNCKIHCWGCAITSLTFPGGTIVDSVMIDGVEIFDTGDDGIFGGIENLTVQNSHIYRVNRHWFTIGHSQLQSGGDCIHFRGNNYLIQNNILDRSNTGNKFCVIYGSQSYHPDRGKILWNTFYPPQDTTDDDGGACIYVSQSAYVEIAYNKFIGRGYNGINQKPGTGAHLEADTVNFYYNLADSVGGFGVTMNNYLPDKELNFLNNTFVHQYDQSVPVVVSFDTTTARNNIFAMEEGVVPFSSYGDFYADTSNNIMVNGDPSNWGTYPGFVDWQNQNYRLKEESAATNAGADYLGCYCDMDSIAVPQQGVRDIGVFEYTDGGAVNTPPTIVAQSFTIIENAANGQVVGTVAASDPDPGQSLTFSIISGNTDNAFQIGLTSGSLAVTNVNALDFETNPSFSLIVQVQDNGPGGLTDQATITVEVTDANEIPQIVNQNFTINENSNNGTQVGIVLASDPDSGQSLAFTILSGNTDNAFQINNTSGILTVTNSSALNYEENPSFSLVVQVEDDGPGNLTNQATITVNLTDVNEVPQIDDQNFAISENSINGSQVGTVVAVDPDNGQSLTFAILSGNTGNAFNINSGSGVITVANSAAVDFEVNPGFNLEVRAQDNGTGNLYSIASIIINLADINEVPEIVNQSFSIVENSSNGTSIGVVDATDPDNGQILTFSIISGNTDNAFQINSSSGLITVSNSTALDFEENSSFALTVRAQDNGPGSLFTEATITISLTDINEIPVIYDQSFAIVENANNGTAVGTVVASDPDNGQSVSYSILSGNIGGAFEINSNSGFLSVANEALLDYETYPSFVLVVNVEDNGLGALSSQANITVNLSDANENPEIESQSFTVNENSAFGTSVGIIDAFDPDNGQTLTFSILAGNVNNAFQVDASSGELIVANSSSINYEEIASFSLTVVVQDNGMGNLTDQAIIDVEIDDVNEIPEIENQGFVIEETIENGELVGTVLASDPDIGQLLTYSILSGNTDGAFSLNSLTGALLVADNSAFDFGSNPIYYLDVQVQDNGSGNLASQAVVTVSLTDINQAPNIENQTFSIAENSQNGELVGEVIATDPDAGQTLTYSIISGNIADAFSINSNSGELIVNNTSVLNYESIPTFSLMVRVEDSGPISLSDFATILVNLTDINEVPEINDEIFAVDENSASGQQVGIVSASDPDNGQTLSYSILSGNDDNAFEIGLNSGIITVLNNNVLNFELSPVFSLIVEVSDNGTGPLTDQATITVNLNDVNEQPEIEDQMFSVEENSLEGQQVGVVLASDPDAGQNISYSIVSGNINNAFGIDEESGEITVANTEVVNFEANPEISLIVQVQDDGEGSLLNTATIEISLIDVNEVPNVDDQEFEIVENSLEGDQVGFILASDPDNGQLLYYSILSGNTNEAFQIGETSGILTVNNSTALNFEETTEFILSVEVEDNGTGFLTDVATIVVNVQDINEAPILEAQEFTIDENTLNGEDVGNVFATDPDQGQSLIYSILSGNSADAFEINSTTGLISVANSTALNYELIPTFSLLVQVVDDGQGNLSSEAFVSISLTDVNENPVVENHVFELNEFSPAGYEVGLVEASDPDAGQSLSFSILSGNTDNAFLIDSETGIISVNNSDALIYEVNPVFNLVVQVQDDGLGALTDEASVIITLIDMTAIESLSVNEDLKYNIFPNPVGEKLNLEMDNLESGKLTIIITTINGEVMLNKEFQVYDNELNLDFSVYNLPRGLYLINIVNGKVAVMDKFIKL